MAILFAPSPFDRDIAVSVHRVLLRALEMAAYDLTRPVRLSLLDARQLLLLPAEAWSYPDADVRQKLPETISDAIAADAERMHPALFAIGLRDGVGHGLTALLFGPDVAPMDPGTELAGAADLLRDIRPGTVMLAVSHVQAVLVVAAASKGLDPAPLAALATACSRDEVADAAGRVEGLLDALAGPTVAPLAIWDVVPFPDEMTADLGGSPLHRDWDNFRSSMNLVCCSMFASASEAEFGLRYYGTLRLEWLSRLIESMETAAKAVAPVQRLLVQVGRQQGWGWNSGGVPTTSPCLDPLTWIREDVLGEDAWLEPIPPKVTFRGEEESGPIHRVIRRLAEVDLDELLRTVNRVGHEGFLLEQALKRRADLGQLAGDRGDAAVSELLSETWRPGTWFEQLKAGISSEALRKAQGGKGRRARVVGRKEGNLLFYSVRSVIRAYPRATGQVLAQLDAESSPAGRPPQTDN